MPDLTRTASDTDLTADDIRSALRDCYDPNLPCNIVDLGLVDTIAIAPDPDAPGATIPGVPARFTVDLRLTPVTPGEAAEAHLRAQITNRLAGLEQVSRTEVSFQQQSPWTPARILPAGRRTLGLEGNPTLIQIR